LKLKTLTAALGFRVKSGWAAAVLLMGPARSPHVCRSFVIDICDPKRPATRQPYHAAMGKLETNTWKLKGRVQIVRRATRQSIAQVLLDCRRKNLKVRQAGLVVGSQIDPALIANPHIRAHALEGQLFRTVLMDALRAGRIRALVFSERDAYSEAAVQLNRSVAELRRSTESLGRLAAGPWRAEQKLAALAAWIALSR
jgi:hypothetical protein